MKLRWILAAAAVLTSGCVHETRMAKTPMAPAPSTDIWDRQIKNAADAGDGDYQLKVLRSRVAAEPNNIAVRMELARAYDDRGYHEIALEICRLAAARFPESGEVQLGLVRALRGANHRQEAIDGMQAFLQQHPQSAPEYYSWLGILRDETGQWPQGEPAHRKAVELSPSADTLHNNLGYNLLMQQKNDAAAAEFREALRLNAASQVARNNLGLALANQNTAQAVANWQSTSDPATAHNNLAAVWMEKGNYPEARKELEIALGYNRTHPAALHNLELVSQLDGNPSTLSAQTDKTRWDRWKSGVKKLFVGPLDEPKTAPVKAAPATVSGEQQQ